MARLMAGTSPKFNTSFVRTQLRNTMIMGLPNTESERATFRWTVEDTYAVADPKGRPYDFTEVPSDVPTPHPDVQIPIAIETPGALVRTAFGPAGEVNDKARVVATVLDVDYPSIEGADLCIFAGNTYRIDYTGPPIGLFDLEVYQLYLTSLDLGESA